MAYNVSLAAAALLFSLPFLNPLHYYPLLTFYEESLAFALGIAAFGAMAWNRREEGVPRITLWALAIGALLLCQPLWRELTYPQPALVAGLYVLWAAALAWLGARLADIDLERSCTVLATALLATCCVSATLGWLQAYGFAERLPWWIPRLGGQAFGFLAQRNLHANLLVCGVASLGYLWSTRRMSWPWTLAAGVLLGGCIDFASSRAALLQLAWLGLAAACFLGRTREARRFLVCIAGVVAVLVVFEAAHRTAAAPVPSGGIATRVVETAQYCCRMQIWEAAARTWARAPFLGVGVGEFTWAHYTTPVPWVGDVPMKPEPYAHDIVLQLLSETGLLITLVVAAGVILWFRAALGRRPAGPGHLWALSIAGVQFVHSLVEFPLWHAQFLALAALCMGLADPGKWMPRARVASLAVPLGTALAGALILVQTLIAHADVMWLVSRGRAPVGGEDAAVYERLRHTLLAPYGDISHALRMPLDGRDLDAKIRLGERAMHFWPIDTLVQNQIVLLALAHRDTEALALLGDLSRLEPETLPALAAKLEDQPRDAISADSPVRRRVEALTVPR
jgi:hypothetical protein